MDFKDFLSNKLKSIEKANWKRNLIIQKPIDSIRRIVHLGEGFDSVDKEVIQFSSNDYLGLSQDPRLIEAALEACKEYGFGATGSRLITGTSALHIQFEEKLAEFKSTEKALFFSSGYAANVGTISALVGKQDLILSDELNHSSILSGAKLSGAELIEYEHLSIDSLEQKLIEYRKDYKNALICTESVFSMDGDIADLKSIVEIAEKYDAWLLVDEAHSTGVFGGEGRGLVYKLGLTDKVHIQMGTCSKALGVEGGYIAGPTELIDFLSQRAKTFVYSTAPSIPVIAALMESLKICQAENWRREKLFKNVQLIRAFCSVQGLELIEGQSQIICLKMPSNEIALKWSEKLMELGVWVQAIRPPTVKTPRLRISVSALHDESHLKKLFEALNTFL